MIAPMPKATKAMKINMPVVGVFVCVRARVFSSWICRRVVQRVSKFV
jgi:hypothetical protein